MTTIQDSIHQNDLPEIGQPLADGTFFVRHWLNGKEYAYVDLGKSAEFAGEWGEYDQDVDGAVSYRDGASNTVAMAEAGSPIAKQAMEIGEGVFIPSILELALLFSAKQAGELSGFADRWYWSSSQYSANFAFYTYFFDGGAYHYAKGGVFRVRPVRKIPITA
ncbi:DUF1566 domain-containing protein [Pseudomonas aeruginosa]|uniref:DUF1566 domain-containing protein n=1 Tax=Pseudomonas aeruginosa TaxID=287 RepID=UPI0003B9927A|nr:DUF1566 domain-containing protein [Pseudomonas aeruginosa]ERV86725.1 hypothetical protein Q041_02482 [Pseudomonas aeruginosa BWHPSA028]MEA8561204.1 DUF1566 domain-containing protein [Pseudomonas aeruginosa]MEA8599675.1 DUF1566 domain-containing protein [Pseudomonas aeruginosa]MEA8605944.1 DUF1566 domain-containing protein [Pseudomonas aeruginosa]HCA7593925.1 DUF1566 domain-containing protein [Pseudomonas aeruginosa]